MFQVLNTSFVKKYAKLIYYIYLYLTVKSLTVNSQCIIKIRRLALKM